MICLQEVNEEDLDGDENSCLVQVAHFNKVSLIARLYD